MTLADKTHRLSELLRASTVPIILADGFQPPFPELSSHLWTQCALHYPEPILPDLVNLLRSFTDEQVQRRMDKCREVYEIWSSGVGARESNLRRERLEVVFKTIWMRLGLD